LHLCRLQAFSFTVCIPAIQSLRLSKSSGSGQLLFEFNTPVTPPNTYGDRNVGWQDQRIFVAFLPKTMNHRGHQAQHAARPLELTQRGPVAPGYLAIGYLPGRSGSFRQLLPA